MLAARHGAEIVQTHPEDIERLLANLRERIPATVAFVVHPDDLDINLVQAAFTLSTRVDSDPFVDFSYGFITGRDGDAATRLVEASKATNVNREPEIKLFGVGSKKMGPSSVQQAAWSLRSKMIPVTSFQSSGDSDESRDEEFITESLPKLARSPILLLASHGFPDGLVGGPKAGDMKGIDLHGTVALNIACFNGVTNTWYQDDWSSKQVKKRTVPQNDSFCLQMIDNGVAAYFAYACARPAGPAMFGDAMILASSGQSTGEIRRADANSVVLAHLLSGATHLEATPLAEGTALKVGRTFGQVVTKMSTGGMLIGDPAYVPFAEIADSDPRTVSVRQENDRLVVDAKIQTPTFHFYASEPINYWNGKGPAMRLATIIPLGNQTVRDVKVTRTPSGVSEYRFVAAVEEHRGTRFLHLKMTFPRPTNMLTLQALAMTGLPGQFEVLTGKESANSDSSSIVFRGGSDQ